WVGGYRVGGVAARTPGTAGRSAPGSQLAVRRQPRRRRTRGPRPVPPRATARGASAATRWRSPSPRAAWTWSPAP
ncbi:MAG: hypothetical protein AVDCRST_MAG11-2594, partial [uncultured Gemmatimonadaceae bacterium]